MEPKNIKIIEQELYHNLKWNDLTQGNAVGNGRSGAVYEYKDKDNIKYAVKLIDQNSNDKESIQSEIQVLLKIKEIEESDKFFPFFNGYVNFKEKKVGEQSKYMYALISELFEGSLLQLTNSRKEKRKKEKEKGSIIQNDGIFSETENIFLFESLIHAGAILEENKMAHRDIKPANILYKRGQENEKEISVYKLTDLSEAKVIQFDDDNTIRGSPMFFSSELSHLYLNKIGSVDPSMLDAHKSDVYSVGLTMLYVNFGESPFQKNRNIKIFLVLSKNS